MILLYKVLFHLLPKGLDLRCFWTQSIEPWEWDQIMFSHRYNTLDVLLLNQQTHSLINAQWSSTLFRMNKKTPHFYLGPVVMFLLYECIFYSNSYFYRSKMANIKLALHSCMGKPFLNYLKTLVRCCIIHRMWHFY